MLATRFAIRPSCLAVAVLVSTGLAHPSHAGKPPSQPNIIFAVADDMGFKSFDPIVEKDQVPTRERRRFRDFTMPDDLKDWFKPGYDDSRWNAGQAPIGTGLYKQGDVSFANPSDWGKGEFIVARTTFEVDTLDYDSHRLSILCPQGFRVYLNGHEIVGYGWWQDKPHYAPWPLGPGEVSQLKKGANVIAVSSNVEYDGTTKSPFGQVDCYFEGLKHSDLE